MERKGAEIKFRRVSSAVWAVIVLLCGVQRLSLTGWKEALLYLLIFLPAISGTSVLSGVLLPKVFSGRKMPWFLLMAGLITAATAVCWALVVELLNFIGDHTSLEMSLSRNPFWLNVLYSLPSVIVFNLSFCGLRFYFEHSAVSPSEKAESDTSHSGTEENMSAGYSETESNFMVLKTNEGLVKVDFDRIEFVESMQNYVSVHIGGGEELLVHRTLTSISEELLPKDFLRVHRRFIVNKSKITSFSGNVLKIGEIAIPVAVSRKKDVLSSVFGAENAM